MVGALQRGIEMSFKHAVALTGGIASGKSTVASKLKEAGFKVIDADKIAHDILDEEHQAIATLFGSAFVKNQKVDRQQLGAEVFADPKKREALESLLHPLIYTRIAEKSAILDKEAKPYIVDIPLFYEGGRYEIDSVIVVYANRVQQCERLMLRDGFSKEEADSRLASQMDIEEKRRKADYVIDNSGGLIQLKTETARVVNEILGEER